MVVVIVEMVVNLVIEVVGEGEGTGEGEHPHGIIMEREGNSKLD